MKKSFRLVVVFMTIINPAFLVSCNAPPENIEIEGTWDNDFSTLTITNASYSVDDPNSDDWDYSGDIVSYNNFSYNIASENPKTGDYGHFIFKIIKHTGDEEQIGTYTVVRWKELVTSNGVTTVKTSEAYPAGWKSPEDASANAKEADHFQMYSSMTKK